MPRRAVGTFENDLLFVETLPGGREHEIVEHCRKLIAGYKCPKRVVIQQEPLPKSGPGKILKTEIRKPFWAGHEKNVN